MSNATDVEREEEGGVVIAIHGVGDRRPGAVLDAVLRGLSHQRAIRVAERWECSDGHCYRGAVMQGHPIVSSVLEVNWDDISHPARSLSEYLTHFFSVLASTLRHATVLLKGDGRASSFLAVYRWVFNALLLWCVVLPIATIAGFIPQVWGQLAWIGFVACAVVLIANLLSAYDRHFRAGRAWAVGVVLVGVASMLSQYWRSLAIDVSTFVYCAVQSLSGIALLVAMGIAWRGRQDSRLEQRLARLAFLYLPFAIFTGLGAVTWAGTLVLARSVMGDHNFDAWSSEYVGSLYYDLPFAETILGIGVAAGGILLVLPLCAVVSSHGAERVHARLIAALQIFPLILLIVFGLFLAHVVAFGDLLFTQRASASQPAFDAWVAPWLWPLLIRSGVLGSGDFSPPGVLGIYLTSSLRLLPFLVYFVGPFKVVLDTVGDVLLYVDPEGALGAGNVRGRTQRRLHDAIRRIVEANDDRTVIVLAHSQGTAIAADVLATVEKSNVYFISTGSPISSFYWRFLGRLSLASPKIPWLNVFRTGDYIAGGVGLRSSWASNVEVTDECLGAGSHSGYFEDPELWRVVGEFLALRAPCAEPNRKLVDSERSY